MAVLIRWRGPEIEAKLTRSIPDAINETTRDAADQAQTSHWWKSHGHLEPNTVHEDATRTGAHEWTGRFGARSHVYWGLFLEYRQPWLRPAADSTFHQLADRLRGRLRWST